MLSKQQNAITRLNICSYSQSMSQAKINQSGFGVVGILIVLVAVGVIVGAGWYVWQAKNKSTNTNQSETTQSTKQTTDANVQPPIKEKESLKLYSNEKYGFSFEYPGSWTVKEDLKKMPLDSLEGTIVATSPNGTNVHFDPNNHSSGGTCAGDGESAAEIFSTKTCQTRTITYLETLDGSTDTNPIYFIQASLTDSDQNGGKTKYYVDIVNHGSALKEGSKIGLFWYPYDEIKLPSGRETMYLTVFAEGKDTINNNSSSYFDSNEVRESTPVLKSFKLL
jgi:hypothetical protein